MTSDPDARDDAPHAGEFSDWLQGFSPSSDQAVPCGDCTACCKAAQFIHVSPDEPAAERIPAALLFPAPGGRDYIVGHDEHGHCPLLDREQCTVYETRPQTCRTYDCRIFAASGIYPTSPAQADVARRSRAWQWAYATEQARARHARIRAAGRFLDRHARRIFDHERPNEIQLSLLAIRLEAQIDEIGAFEATEEDSAQRDALIARIRIRINGD